MVLVTVREDENDCAAIDSEGEERTLLPLLLLYAVISYSSME